MKDTSADDLSFFLEMMGDINRGKAAGSLEFWETVATELKSRGTEQFNEYQISRIYRHFSNAGCINKDIQAVRKSN